MRTRNQSKQQNQQPIGNREAKKPSVSQSHKETLSDGGTLTAVSLKAVGKLLKRANPSSRSRLRKQDLSQCDSAAKLESGLVGTDNQGSGTRDTQNNAEAEGGSFQHTKNDGKEDTRVTQNDKGAEGCSQDAKWDTRLEDTVEGGSFQCTNNDRKEETDEFDWEDGSLPILHSTNNHHKYPVMEMTIEFDGSPDSAKRKSVRRASAEDKELAELVHKVHLLCLLGRGRLIDNACNDPLIQASLLSLLPTHLLKISEVAKLTTKALSPLVTWFHNNFRIRSPSSTERSIHSALAFASEAREGTPEEVAALSVALFRALNLTTRFVSILDVASLKPDLNKSESIGQDARKVGGGIFNSSTLMVARSNQVSPVKQFASVDKGGICETSSRGACRTEDTKSTSITSKEEESLIIDKLSDMASLASDVRDDLSDACLIKKSVGSKRKGDVEFEMQLEMALSATAVEIPQSDMSSDVKNGHNSSENLSSPFKRMKRITSELPSSSQGISTAIGSKKIGAPLYWAEIYCSGENLTGRWVHVDAVNAIIDGEQKVEAAVAACKTSLRYAIAFAGFGAKDVTRRYCMKWYKVASQRINSIWWDAVLAPMKELESTATEGVVNLERGGSNGDSKAETLKTSDHLAKECCLPDIVSSPSKLSVEVPTDYSRKMDAESSVRNSFVATRASLEDMELETRALTEPLPTNQQAYKSHNLYAIERWLTKYEILYPKGPVLGFCSGHPVYPRTCVQTLHTKERWLREGLQVNADEIPAKVLKRSLKPSKAQALEADDHDEEDSQDTIALYGKWQTKPICLPRAINGIVPKNERGQVDVWSEKSLPPGTVHLRLPRVVPVARRLEIDFAPAMVGFEFRNGRSMPVFDGIVVCAEFKDAVLEAYAEEEERREAEEKRRNETQATLRWYQLLSSIVTRQRLDNYYGDGASSHVSNNIEKQTDKINLVTEGGEDDKQSPIRQQQNVEGKKPDVSVRVTTEDHEHVFLTDEPLPDGESVSRTKRCHCGFSIEVEEL